MAAPDPTFSTLTPAERNLVSLMRSVWFGRLTGIPVREGQPQLGPPMKVTRLVKLRAGRGQGEESPPSLPGGYGKDFPLRSEVVELLRQVRAMGRGTIERVEVMNGLPTLAELTEPLADTASGPTSTRTSAR